jgi:hypothetical protein
VDNTILVFSHSYYRVVSVTNVSVGDVSSVKLS